MIYFLFHFLLIYSFEHSKCIFIMLLHLKKAFHYAFPVHDLEVAKHFYGEVLGCKEGRSSDKVGREISFWTYLHQDGLNFYVKYSNQLLTSMFYVTPKIIVARLQSKWAPNCSTLCWIRLPLSRLCKSSGW